MLLISDETTRDEIAEAITHVNAYAERQPHIIGWGTWERAHQKLNVLLSDWEKAAS